MEKVLAGLSLLLVACVLILVVWRAQLPAWNAGKLVVIVPETAHGAEAEFERELAQLFAERLNAKLETIPMQPNKVRSSLRKHKAHLAAASLRSETDTDGLRFGPGYQSVRELVVCNRDSQSPKKLDGLAEMKLSVLAGSAQEAALREAQEKFPALQWQARHKLTVQDLLSEVAESGLNCAAANELQFADARNYHPNLVATLDIAQPSKLAWGFPDDTDPALIKEVQTFFADIQQDGTLRSLLDRYYGHSRRLGTMDSAAFISRRNTLLPRYRHLFEEAATVTGEDWKLLAALAYQESQWDPLATSATNVRGMMMLTENTADRMRVRNRLDPRESILAGAKYLVLIKEQMPDRIPEPDRTWLALAAYNQGYGHLEDARILTTRAGLNPDSWADVKKWMPLLNRPEYYETLKHGYARGGEAVILVESIRSYYDMLKKLESGKTSTGLNSFSYRLREPSAQGRTKKTTRPVSDDTTYHLLPHASSSND
ncbi:MAG: membrane-bound lytic murein transglycosylase MltF [Gallionella sp.]|nr:membrane-bound lytic murein transglycosylase MltF [Gallionella sp.]